MGLIFMGTKMWTGLRERDRHRVANCIAPFYFPGTLHTMLDTRGASHYGHGGSRALEEASRAPAKDAIHTLITSNGAPYMNYQTRILMGTYELIRQMPGGEKHVGLTRILHRSKPDILMNAIETFHATPLQPECDGWCEYPVSDRANAVRQFFDAAETNKSMIRV